MRVPAPAYTVGMGARQWGQPRPGAAALAISALLLTGCANAPSSSSGTEAGSSTAGSTEFEQSFDRDEALASELDELIVEELPPLDLTLSSSIPSDCGVEAGGCYVSSKSAIFLAEDLTDFRRPELLAHEYLHFVWERDNLERDTELGEALQRAFADDEGLGALVPPWQDSYVRSDGTIEPTELFSYACTGLQPGQLGSTIAEHCERYLNMEELPVSQEIRVGDLLDEITKLRAEKGLPEFEDNTYAVAASQARADLFTPYSQVSLGEHPESVRQHLDAGCSPARYGARLTRPSDLEQMVKATDEVLDGALTSSDYSSVGIVTKKFDYIDASGLFGERTLQVNATLVVTTVCG